MSNEKKDQSGIMGALNNGIENMMDAVGNLFNEDTHARNESTINEQGSMNNLSKEDAEIASALKEIALKTISNKNEKQE